MNIGQGNFPIQDAPFLDPQERYLKMQDEQQQMRARAQQIQQALMANQMQRAIQPSQQEATIARNQSLLQTMPSQTQADILTNQNTIATAPYKQAADIATQKAIQQTILKQKLAEAAQKQAEANLNARKVNDPFFQVGANPVAQLVALRQLGEKYGTDSPIYKQANQAIQANTGRNEYYSMRAGLSDYNSLTAPSKLQVNAMLSGMGYDPIQGIQMLRSVNPNTGKNYTLQDLAALKGQKLEDIEARYPLTTASQNIQQTREIGAKELDAVYDQINSSVAPYSQGWLGEARLAKDSLSSDPEVKKRVGDYYGAQRASLELAAIQARTAGLGRIGKEAIDEFRNAQLGQMRGIPILRDPEIFKAAADKFNRINKEILKAAHQYTSYPYKNTEKKYSEPSELKIPTFSNKEEFQLWYKALSPDQQEEVRRKLK